MQWPMNSTGGPRMTLGYSTPLEVYAQHLHRLSQQPESVH